MLCKLAGVILLGNTAFLEIIISYFQLKINNISAHRANSYSPFAQSATSLGASPHHLPKATSFEATPQHRSFVPFEPRDLGIIATRLHRRIVVCGRLDALLTLGLADALLWAVSLVKNNTQLFLTSLPNELRSSYNPKLMRHTLTPHNQEDNNKKDTKSVSFLLFWLRGRDLNHTTFGL